MSLDMMGFPKGTFTNWGFLKKFFSSGGWVGFVAHCGYEKHSGVMTNQTLF